ncbi:MAG: amidohydrolase [Anaerolineales bacterium]
MAAILLTNARIYTMDDDQPVVNSLLIQDGVIQAQGLHDPSAEILDLHGAAVLPGLIDAHIHLDHFAQSLEMVELEGYSQEACLERIRSKAQELPPGSWILGHGWNQNNWDDGYPDASILDQISTQHPIYLTAKSLHAAWVNSKALELAGIKQHTPDPPDGKFKRDYAGRPSGILFEGAMTLVSHRIPEPSVEQTAELIAQAQEKLWSMGITGVHDFDRSRCFTALQHLNGQNRLYLRVVKSLPVDLLDQAIEIGLRSGFGDDWLRIGSVKAFADGALGPRTAAMLQPYEGETENVGILLLDQETLVDIGLRAASNGLSIAVHAIGDRANHELLNAMEQVRNAETRHKLGHLRHRIEHVQILHPADKNRLARQNIIASMQPIHAISDMTMADRYWGQRSAGAYAWRDQIDAGARVIFGSDAPVDSPNPFWGLHAAVARRKVDEKEGWYPEQRLSLQEALTCYTVNPAYAAGQERMQGKLIEGYFADLIVLPADPFEIAVDELYHLQPEKTMVGGKWVFTA